MLHAAVTRGVHAGGPVQRGDLESRVVRQTPETGPLEDRARLQQRIVQKRLAGLFREALHADLPRAQQSNRKPFEQRLHLSGLPVVEGREHDHPFADRLRGRGPHPAPYCCSEARIGTRSHTVRSRAETNSTAPEYT